MHPRLGVQTTTLSPRAFILTYRLACCVQSTQPGVLQREVVEKGIEVKQPVMNRQPQRALEPSVGYLRAAAAFFFSSRARLSTDMM